MSKPREFWRVENPGGYHLTATEDPDGERYVLGSAADKLAEEAGVFMALVRQSGDDYRGENVWDTECKPLMKALKEYRGEQ